MASPLTLCKTGLFSAVVPGTVAGIIPSLLARRDRGTLPIGSRPARIAGFASLLSGLALYVHTAWRFADEGEGTPAPIDEPDELVRGGIYAHVRNPMYVAVLLCIIGHGLLRRSPLALWWAVGCWLGFHRRVVDDEEPHLREKHGAAYEAYCEAVPRWLPRVRAVDR
ncbi:methyltransferase family protein [Natrononativus amylolyticus]|uniref:methyltransferase family protein n=1 Tax=Natrononativus amylolyticus TaxID=2963434 RepID=UPI0020CE1B7B|nr:isoprenylcysteine carboxylmethyltransferase family protein [Natrononativus amylolyticus]